MSVQFKASKRGLQFLFLREIKMTLLDNARSRKMMLAEGPLLVATSDYSEMLLTKNISDYFEGTTQNVKTRSGRTVPKMVYNNQSPEAKAFRDYLKNNMLGRNNVINSRAINTGLLDDIRILLDPGNGGQVAKIQNANGEALRKFFGNLNPENLKQLPEPRSIPKVNVGGATDDVARSGAGAAVDDVVDDAARSQSPVKDPATSAQNKIRSAERNLRRELRNLNKLKTDGKITSNEFIERQVNINKQLDDLKRAGGGGGAADDVVRSGAGAADDVVRSGAGEAAKKKAAEEAIRNLNKAATDGALLPKSQQFGSVMPKNMVIVDEAALQNIGDDAMNATKSFLNSKEGQLVVKEMTEEFIDMGIPEEQITQEAFERLFAGQFQLTTDLVKASKPDMGLLFKSAASKITPGALGVIFPYIQATLEGREVESVGAGELALSVGMSYAGTYALPILAAKIPFFWPLIGAGLAYYLHSSLIGDMSDIWVSIKKTAKKNVGMTWGASEYDLILNPSSKGRGVFFQEEDFWQYVDDKYPGKYTNGVLRPSDIDPGRAMKIYHTMAIVKQMKKVPAQKARLSSLYNGQGIESDFDRDIKMLSDCFRYGFLNQVAWYEGYKSKFEDQEKEKDSEKPAVGTIKVEPPTGDKQGEQEASTKAAIKDPGDKATVKFNWKKYVGNEPLDGDKQQIKALWINRVAELTGNSKSFNSWARWYNTLRKTGKIGIGNQKILAGSPVKSGGDTKNWNPGDHMSPDQVEFIMRKMYQGIEIKPEKIGTFAAAAGKDPIQERKISLKRLISSI